MATNTTTGVLVCSDGTNIPLKTELVEGTESALKTDSVYTVSITHPERPSPQA